MIMPFCRFLLKDLDEKSFNSIISWVLGSLSGASSVMGHSKSTDEATTFGVQLLLYLFFGHDLLKSFAC